MEHPAQSCKKYMLHNTPRDLNNVQVQDIVSAIAKAWNNMSHRLHHTYTVNPITATGDRVVLLQREKFFLEILF
ncbi:hypothetical protein RYX56_07435 [Alkalihalophilus lindianensis]|uniref:Uncharacterized protein n=1 Tax=Alkalihalophilus lindianensis TaxID=1630542 RepID=A0ABU3XA62_9BACI|nr:hypothetical protein [Alkalihalophilus lindianensis]MDV2684198.1 hypothetical protein [Alkalihalophilus lindianensis]